MAKISVIDTLDRHLDSVLHETAGYAVATCTLRDPVLKEEIMAYGVYNKSTSIREAETRRYTTAVNLVAQLQADVDELDNPQQELPFPETMGGVQ